MANAGGFTAYANRVVQYGSRGSEPCKNTRPVTVKSGQVIKAMSWVTSDSAGKVIAAANVTELASTAFSGTIASTDTVILGGLTLTATATMTSAEIVAAFISQSTTKGTFSGTLSGWVLQQGATTAILEASSTSSLTNATDFAVTGTHTSLTTTVTTVAGTTSITPVIGLLVYDVNATSADAPGQIYTSGNFWEEEILWEVDVAVDTVDVDGTTTAVTAYRTGATTSLLRQKFIEQTAGGTEFAIGTWTAGEREA